MQQHCRNQAIFVPGDGFHGHLLPSRHTLQPVDSIPTHNVNTPQLQRVNVFFLSWQFLKCVKVTLNSHS